MYRFVALDPDQLDTTGARRLEVDAHPGYPCRVSLVDATIGETVLALSYTHHDVDSPYRASGPIFIREDAVRAEPEEDAVPAFLLHRELSLRAYDADAMMIAASTLPGRELDAGIRALLEDPRVAYLQVHNAGPGCFDCTVARS